MAVMHENRFKDAFLGYLILGCTFVVFVYILYIDMFVEPAQLNSLRVQMSQDVDSIEATEFKNNTKVYQMALENGYQIIEDGENVAFVKK